MSKIIINKKIAFAFFKLCWAVICLIICCWVLWWIMSSIFHPSYTQKEIATREEDLPPINSEALTVSNLTSVYDQNEVAADQRFKGKRLKVIGHINQIRKDFLDTPIVELAVFAHPLMSTRCEFSRKDENILARLGKGTQITIVGTCNGSVLGSVSLRHCRIEKFRDETGSIRDGNGNLISETDLNQDTHGNSDQNAAESGHPIIDFKAPEKIKEGVSVAGEVTRGWLGAAVRKTPGIMRAFGFKKEAVAVVSSVYAGGPADKAGIKKGDVILKINAQ
jgi:hypothetical protein